MKFLPSLNGVAPVFSQRLFWWDYAFGFVLLLGCFFAFFHIDIYLIGQDAVSMLFGDVLSFYDNAADFRGAYQNYPVFVYAILGLWMLPLKLFGVLTGPDTFSMEMVYWLKLLTSLVYVLMCVVFYRITCVYSSHTAWCKFATAVCAVAPMGLFSQFLFSQVDIFYVTLSLVGFLMFLRGRLRWASAAFGMAMAFKYFPAFVFVPLLLLFEKRLANLLVSVVIFLAPTAFVHVLYRNSPAFAEGVSGFNVLEKLYAFPFAVGGFQVFPLFALFVALCCVVYLANVSRERLPRVAAYVYVVAAAMPFIVFMPHPQWLLFVTPPMALVMLLNQRPERFLCLDILGVLIFLSITWINYPNGVDIGMQHFSLFGVNIPTESRSFGEILRNFGPIPFKTTAWAFKIYLLLFLIGNFSVIKASSIHLRINYHHVRLRMLAGVLLYALPVLGLLCFDVFVGR